MSLLKSKINSATVTETEPDYEGSITIDEAIMQQADILPAEELMVLNANNDARFITYCIKGGKNSGTICLNGPCAKLAQVGDKVMVLCFSLFSEEEAKKHKPRIITLDENNKISKII